MAWTDTREDRQNKFLVMFEKLNKKNKKKIFEYINSKQVYNLHDLWKKT